MTGGTVGLPGEIMILTGIWIFMSPGMLTFRADRTTQT